MTMHTPALPAQVTLHGLVLRTMHRISDAIAIRSMRRQNEATIQLLGQMDDRLLDDIGMAPVKKTPAALDTLAQMNPAFLAATAFSLPRKERR